MANEKDQAFNHKHTIRRLEHQLQYTIDEQQQELKAVVRFASELAEDPRHGVTHTESNLTKAAATAARLTAEIRVLETTLALLEGK